MQRLYGWKGGIFESDSDVTVVTHEREAQEARLQHLMSQGVKESLVPHPTRWPGVQSAKALLTGSMRMKGVWVRRSELYERVRKKRRRSKAVIRRQLTREEYLEYEDRLTLELSPLPCWDELDRKEIAMRSRELCRKVLHDYADERSRVAKGYRKRLMDRSRFARYGVDG